MAIHLLITDSGLGGLGICAGIEHALRTSGAAPGARLTYFNAWPEEGVGYNSMPDAAARVACFDRALDRMAAERPDRIVIACNTLSVLYGQTAFARTCRLPVTGIIDTGIELFSRALAASPSSRIALFGTRITISSGVHRDGLIARGVIPGRIATAGCHGLAGAIERDVTGPDVDRLIQEGVAQIAFRGPDDRPVFAALCCTHFGYVADRFRIVLQSHLGQPVRILDPNQGLVDRVVHELGQVDAASPADPPVVSVVSKVRLDERARAGIARLVADVSPATADALNRYEHVPDLF